MVPICMARGLADGRHQELLAFRVAGWGWAPALVRRAAAPRAYGPVAI
jgi:hypothetical protein